MVDITPAAQQVEVKSPTAPKRRQVTLRLLPSVVWALNAAAAEHERTFSRQVEVALIDWMRRREEEEKKRARREG